MVHHPVLNRIGETIASAVTNLDLHDLARLACTYGLPACFIVTPLVDQKALVAALLEHWCEGVGKEMHPDREQALRCLRVVDSIDSACDGIEKDRGRRPKVWATSARECGEGLLTLSNARKDLLADSEIPRLILLGTGWGLAPPVLDEADAVLEAIGGVNGYNHLSVRCAAAVLVDRLLFNGVNEC